MNEPKVTIALSAYNVADYVDAALQCIESQTYNNIEILCIDDASTDGTFEKISKRAERDSRYRVIRQYRNQGLSVSRNTAISEAKGKYIVMLDGDDLFDKDMILDAVDAAESHEADMVLWDYVPFCAESQITQRQDQKSQLEIINPLNKVALLRRPGFMWVRLLKIEKIRAMNIRFEPGLTKQDIPIHWRLVTELKDIAILPKKLSFYRLQPNATSRRKDRSVFSLAKVMDIVKNNLNSSGTYDFYRDEFLRSRLSLLYGMYDFIRPELKDEALGMIIDRLDFDAKSYLAGKNELDFRTKVFYGKLDGRVQATLIYNLIVGMRSLFRGFKEILK